MLELTDTAAQCFGDPRGDPGVAEEKAAHVGLGHDADDDVVEGFGEAVVHLLADDDHLAEDGAGFDDRGGEGASVGGDPEDADAALLEDEQGLQRLVGCVDELP